MKCFFFGFSVWKHRFVRPFFADKPIFINPLNKNDHLTIALRKGLNAQSQIYIWGKKYFSDVERFALEEGIPIFRVEDGFIRSVGLGSDLTQPYSQVVDARGIYFDPGTPSDLEYLLQYHQFSGEEIARARSIRKFLLEKKLSKYNVYENTNLQFPSEKLIVVVPGQVEDDASIRFGGEGMGNLELLKRVRESRPDAYIIYKPHPDVLAGNRVGRVEEGEALRHCDRIVSEVGIDTVLSRADEVHTITSLVGFEAMMRGIRVVTYGMPFYAGWGLSDDRRTCDRRTRKLSIDELVAAAYLLYPRYIHPDTLRPCTAEAVLETLERRRGRIKRSRWVKGRNWVSRKGQMAIRMIRGLG